LALAAASTVAALPVAASAPEQLSTVIALLLYANSLELIIERDIDLNHKLVVAGLGNLIWRRYCSVKQNID
jgi:hypothetical protein